MAELNYENSDGWDITAIKILAKRDGHAPSEVEPIRFFLNKSEGWNAESVSGMIRILNAL